MPGKAKAVIPEVVNQIAYKTAGNDLTVTMAAEAGQLELNVQALLPAVRQPLFTPRRPAPQRALPELPPRFRPARCAASPPQ
jgi:hypothetical protein